MHVYEAFVERGGIPYDFEQSGQTIEYKVSMWARHGIGDGG